MEAEELAGGENMIKIDSEEKDLGGGHCWDTCAS